MELLTFALLGVAIGSFLNVVIIRLPQMWNEAHPLTCCITCKQMVEQSVDEAKKNEEKKKKKENLAFPASHCMKCNTPLKWYHNIPLFSWIFLGGKCAYCNEKISIQYPLVELLTMMIFIFSYLKTENFIFGIIISAIFSSFLAMSLIDLKEKVAPDSLNFLALLLAVFASSYILNNFINMLLFVGAFSLLRLILTSFKGMEAMGEADIIVAGTIGALLGIKYGAIAIFLSAFIALPAFAIVKNRENFQLPYIPFLALSTFIVFMFDKQVDIFIEFLYG